MSRFRFLLFEVMITLLGLFLAHHAAASDFAGSDILVPVVVRSQGAQGSHWQTDLVISNISRKPVNVPFVLTFTRNNAPDQMFSSELHPLATILLRDVVYETFGHESALGIVRIIASSADAKIVARTRTYNTAGISGEVGSSMMGLPLSKLGQDTYLTGLSGIGGNRTNVGISNPQETEVNLFVSLLEPSGEIRGGFATTVQPRGLLQINDIFVHFGVAPFEGAAIRITSSRGVFAYATIIRSDSGDADLVTGTAEVTGGETITPACPNPAPLYLAARPTGDWIVMFTDGIDAAQKTASLASKYGFIPKDIWEAIRGFVAPLTPEIVAKIRCEPGVSFVEQNGIVKLPR